MLHQAARLGDLRLKHRVGDTALYQLLHDITMCAFSTRDAARGNQPRQDPASEEREYWTTQQVARATRQAERTIRLACQTKALPAQKSAGAWRIRATDATTYIEAHRAA